MVIRSNHSWNRCSNNCRKFCIQLCSCICKFCHQPIIPSKDCIHITKSCTEQGTFAFKPPGLIKSTDISGTATGIADYDNPAKFIEYRHRAGLIRCKWRQIFSKSSHCMIPPPMPQTVCVTLHSQRAAVPHSNAYSDILCDNIPHLFQWSD